ncbi:MAG: RNA polymerase sigma factor RpoE [Planctomycetota bacterium]
MESAPAGKNPEGSPSKRIVHALKLMPELADSDLIAATLRGSEEAFRSLVERYGDRVARLLSRYSRDAMECEDLLQDVFLKVYRKLHTFQHDSAFFTWLYRVAVNTATDHLAKRKRRRLHLVEDEAVLDLRPDLENESTVQPLIDEETARVTRAVLEKLPEKYRTILILREYEDLSYTEMAEVLGCNLGTVESRLFRARQRFKDALERHFPDFVPTRGGVR